jgi:ABC-2 type transport system ATP-binding protein
LADQIAIIYRGKILTQGTLDELKTRILGAPEYEIKFSEDWDSHGWELPERVDLLSRTKNSVKIRVERPQESNPVILNRLAALSVPVMAFQEEPRTLEQVYLKVMSEAKGHTNVH